jgi:hypothetical protein
MSGAGVVINFGIVAMAGVNGGYILSLDRPLFKGFRLSGNDEVWVPNRTWTDRFGGWIATSVLCGIYEWQEMPSDGATWPTRGFRLYRNDWCGIDTGVTNHPVYERGTFEAVPGSIAGGYVWMIGWINASYGTNGFRLM